MFTPHTEAEVKEMLGQVGVRNIEELFLDVPEKYRFPELDLPPALTEMEALAQLQDMAAANASTQNMSCFLGAGSYNHYVPAVIDSLLRRGEFYTAYTPYQPELSQGTLQAIFEYQSLIASLTGMEACNASHYDGATATAEAGIMALSHFRGTRNKIIVSPSVHPEYREVLKTYLNGQKDVVVLGDDSGNDPLMDPDQLVPLIDNHTALVIVQYPDFFGRLFDYETLSTHIHEAGALFAVVVNPTALGLFKSPGEFGADVVVGEGQPLGIPMSYGGPYLGLFASKKEFVRKISGRLVGETTDADGRRGYVLTLTAREQHIRREKATSNICSNEGLMALASTIYLSLLGKSGLRRVAELCYHKAHYAADKIAKIPGFHLCHDTPFFHEFAVCCPMPVADVNDHLLENGIIGGYDLGTNYPGLKDHMLISVTETVSRDEIDVLCEILEEISND